MATETQRGGAATKLEDGSAASGQRSAFSGQLVVLGASRLGPILSVRVPILRRGASSN